MTRGISASLISAGWMTRASQCRTACPVWSLPIQTHLRRQFSSDIPTPPILQGVTEQAIEGVADAASIPQQHPKADKASTSPRTFMGVITSAGKMSKTAKVRVVEKVWNNHIRKHFFRTINQLVHDPASAVREGDIVRVVQGFRSSKHKRCIVTEIVAPFGTGERTMPIGLTEIESEKLRKRDAKRKRREARRKGLDVGELEVKTTMAEGNEVAPAEGIQTTLNR